MSIKNAKGRHGAPVSIAAIEKWEWMDRARCKETDLASLIDRFPKRSKEHEQEVDKLKKKFCFPCPIRVECLTHIVDQENKDKIYSSDLWGGTYGKERHLLRKEVKESSLPTERVVVEWIKKKTLNPDRFTIEIKDSKSKKVISRRGARHLREATSIVNVEIKKMNSSYTVTITNNDTGEVTVP